MQMDCCLASNLEKKSFVQTSTICQGDLNLDAKQSRKMDSWYNLTFFYAWQKQPISTQYQFPISTILIGGESQNEIDRDQILNFKIQFSLFSWFKGYSYLAGKTLKSGWGGVENSSLSIIVLKVKGTSKSSRHSSWWHATGKIPSSNPSKGENLINF